MKHIFCFEIPAIWQRSLQLDLDKHEWYFHHAISELRDVSYEGVLVDKFDLIPHQWSIQGP